MAVLVISVIKLFSILAHDAYWVNAFCLSAAITLENERWLKLRGNMPEMI